MNRTIKDARWSNDSKTQIFCKFHYEDGRILDAYISETSEGNPDWKEIIETFGVETLDKNTQNFLRELSRKRNIEKQRAKEKEETLKNEALFNAKLEAFSMEEIRGSKNTQLKSKIRKAKSMTEIHVYSSVLVALETLNANSQPEQLLVESVDDEKTTKKKTTKK